MKILPSRRPCLRALFLATGCLTALANTSSAAEGALHLLNRFNDWPWTGGNGATEIRGSHPLPENGGTTVTFSFLNPWTNVDVSNSASPSTSGATASTFGVTTESGLGVGDSMGYFNRQEQFSLKASHKIAIKELQFDEYTGGEVVHLGWTQGGTAKSLVLSLDLTPGGRIKGKDIVNPIPSTTNLVVDANTSLRITNVGPAGTDAGRLRLIRMVTVPVFSQTPTYTTQGTDAYEQMFGVNLAGGDGTSKGVPGKLNEAYHYPKRDGMDYFNSKGLKLIRVPFKWQRIQRVLGGPLSAEDVNELDRVVTDAEDRGMKVILDMHDYGGRGAYKIGSPEVSLENFKDVWAKIAERFNGRPGIYGYGLSNEPNDMGIYSWPKAAQAGADGVRSKDKHAWIIVGGENYSSSSKWIEANPNLNVTDLEDRLMYEAHTYFNDARSGEGYKSYEAEYAHPTRGVYLLEPFVRWLKQRNARGFLGEYGAPTGDSRWLTILENYMKYAGANGLSGTYWVAGAWVDNSSDLNSVQPDANYTIDRPQMAVIEKNFAYGYVRPEVIVDNRQATRSSGWTSSTPEPFKRRST